MSVSCEHSTENLTFFIIWKFMEMPNLFLMSLQSFFLLANRVEDSMSWVELDSSEGGFSSSRVGRALSIATAGIAKTMSIAESTSITKGRESTVVSKSTIAKRVGSASKAISTISISTMERICLRLSISRALAIAIAGIAETMSIAKSTSITKGRVSTVVSKATIAKRVSSASKTISTISISTIEGIGFRFSLGLTLGNMDNTSRVGNISSSTSIGTVDSRDGSRSSTMDSYSVGNIGDTIANSMVDGGSIADSMVDRGSISNMSNVMSITNTSIAKVA